jgi:hypothetical protein
MIIENDTVCLFWLHEWNLWVNFESDFLIIIENVTSIMIESFIQSTWKKISFSGSDSRI